MEKYIPWYKQFWPWFLIVLPSAVVIASIVTLNIAFKYADEPVTGDYEKHGLTVLHKSTPEKSETAR
ncbi:MAG: FixH family protein [Spongiibacteraceae bacterium]